MSSATVSKALISDTDANYRLWGKAISDQLATSWTLTSDTGNDSNGKPKANWTTDAKPGGVSTVVAYEIWKSNDAAGSIVDIYMKIEYGSFSTNANQPQIWLTFGWASDGSGNLTGITSTRTGIHINTTASGTLVNCNLGVGTGWIAMVFGTVASLCFHFSVERTKNSSLADQNELLIYGFGTGAGTGFVQVITQTVAYSQTTQQAPSNNVIIPPTSNSLVSAVTGLGLLFGYRAGYTNPSMNVMAVHTGDLGGVQGTVSVTTYGAAHTYIINQGAGGTINCFGFLNVATLDLLSRFE